MMNIYHSVSNYRYLLKFINYLSFLPHQINNPNLNVIIYDDLDSYMRVYHESIH